MPSFQDSIFLFILALILFGPKRLPQLARELGKWVGEFRRASNEFKMQMEEEMRQTEQAERMKKIEAMEAAAPQSPALESASAAESVVETPPDPEVLNADGRPSPPPDDFTPAPTTHADGVLPIATEGELSIMPPATGLPSARTSSRAAAQEADTNPLGGLIDSIPSVDPEGPSKTEPETTHAH